MPIYEGIVLNIKDKDKAEVIIYPTLAGIPDAPQLDNIICHTPSEGSIIKIEAINSYINAKVGDLVSVEYKPKSIGKNIIILIGIPLLMTLIGAFVKGTLSATIISFGIGIIIAIFLYRITYKKEGSPIIISILKNKDELKENVCRSGEKVMPNCKHCPLFSN